MEDTDKLVQQLIIGFETLQDEYQKLFVQHDGLERKLQNAREQYNELSKLYGKDRTTTPPLSLPASPKQTAPLPTQSASVTAILAQKQLRDAACKVGQAAHAVQRLRSVPRAQTGNVTIHSGPSADALEPPIGSMMPSISESPLEQDFTVQGVPSKLGCPFATMAGKKLSSHAASIVSRYNQRGSSLGAAGVNGSGAVGSGPVSGNASVTSRINGRESVRGRASRRYSSNIRDPIKAEICGLSDHSASNEAAPVESPRPVEEAGGVCPIRFLNQHSPEEVATYFENHKHELPRSHEVCVRRYQANEDQIRELDAKYGNLVSMIQGLGQKHQPMLPNEPAEEEVEETMEPGDREKIAGWARSVSAQAAQPLAASTTKGNNDNEDTALEHNDVEQVEDRQQRFDRPLREIRVGESPSRPWGYNVPAKYTERRKSDASSRPAKVPPAEISATVGKTSDNPGMAKEPSTNIPLRCPLGFDQMLSGSGAGKTVGKAATAAVAPKTHDDDGPNVGRNGGAVPLNPTSPSKDGSGLPHIAISGPVFIGYNADDAARILQQAGLEGRS